jgi:dihydroxyacetone kinase-like predicted kinase
VQIGGVRVREGDFIGLVNGNLTVAGQDMDQVIADTLQRMHIERYEIVTLYFGAEVSSEQARDLAARIKRQYSGLEIEVVDGGQPYYAYILSAE